MWALARMFNPSHAAQHLDPDGVDALSDIQPLAYHNLIVHGHEVGGPHAYTSPRAWASWSTRRAWRPSPTPSCSSGAATATQVSDVGGGGAHHVLHMTPNSASAERVFSLLKAITAFPTRSSSHNYVVAAKPCKKTSRVQGTSGTLRQSAEDLQRCAIMAALSVIDAGTPAPAIRACP
jgi:hypothetical protein